ncbi:MAG TPA: mannose-1-phosphate guanylyltransferase/mannose-6-phosphate isomerase [Bauldia sp.]|nr:mannose-1-phosphate guanylyltransferase/mannose-6-phosphate isomerase [Bauldia sp.]
MIVPVIMSGGAGTRLWPASRQDAPKPFLPLVGGKSSFALTLERVSDRGRFAEPVVITSVDHRYLVEQALKHAGAKATLLLEPIGRDTAAAVGAAAAYVAAKDKNATILVLAADHVIEDGDAFARVVDAALPAAEAGRIVVFGVKPTGPSTSFGYIRPGAALGQGSAKAVDQFVEKPDAGRAAELVKGGYLWNSGIFLMRAATALSELDAHAGEIGAAVRKAIAAAKNDAGATTIDKAAFETAPKKSIDYAVMEKTKLAAVVPADFDWNDLGTWGAVWDESGKDGNGNVAAGNVTFVDAKDNYVSSETDTVGVVGVDDLVVVAADGSILVTTRSRSAEVKELVAAVQAKPEANFGDFIRHFRPWGNYQSLDQGPRHQVKRIVVTPGARLSLQKHFHRAEHWTVVSGIADITIGPDMDNLKTIRVNPNESVHIPLGHIHRMANPGTEPMTLIEVQIGDYLGEDDIVRLQDDYGRKDA